MGTNYYIADRYCDHCKRSERERHIGKSSWGWNFALHIYPDEGICTLEDWKPILERSIIADEYGTIVSYEEMLKEITAREHPKGLLRHSIQPDHCIRWGEGTWDYLISDFC